MATMKVVDERLHVRFSPVERLAVWRAGVDVPLSAVVRVECVAEPVGQARGGRMGFLVSGVVKVGIWGLGTGIRQLVSVRRKVPGLRVTLDRAVAGGQFDELLISTKDAGRLAGEISGGVGRA